MRLRFLALLVLALFPVTGSSQTVRSTQRFPQNIIIDGTLNVAGTINGAAFEFTGDLNIGSGKFTVDSATGNIYSAGTLITVGSITSNTSLNAPLIQDPVGAEIKIDDSLWVTGALQVDGTSELASLVIQGTVQPSSDGTQALGSSTKRWSNIHLNLPNDSGFTYVVVGNNSSDATRLAYYSGTTTNIYISVPVITCGDGVIRLWFQAGLLVWTSEC